MSNPASEAATKEISDRLKHPLLGPFLFSYFLQQWRLYFIAFDGSISTADKINQIKEKLTDCNIIYWSLGCVFVYLLIGKPLAWAYELLHEWAWTKFHNRLEAQRRQRADNKKEINSLYISLIFMRTLMRTNFVKNPNYVSVSEPIFADKNMMVTLVTELLNQSPDSSVLKPQQIYTQLRTDLSNTLDIALQHTDFVAKGKDGLLFLDL